MIETPVFSKLKSSHLERFDASTFSGRDLRARMMSIYSTFEPESPDMIKDYKKSSKIFISSSSISSVGSGYST